MKVFLAAAVVFGLAFLGLAAGVIRGKRSQGCACKAAERLLAAAGTDRQGPTSRPQHPLVQLQTDASKKDDAQ